MKVLVKDDPAYFQGLYGKNKFLANGVTIIIQGERRVEFLELAPDEMEGVIQMLKRQKRGAELFYKKGKDRAVSRKELLELTTLGHPEKRTEYTIHADYKD